MRAVAMARQGPGGSSTAAAEARTENATMRIHIHRACPQCPSSCCQDRSRAARPRSPSTTTRGAASEKPAARMSPGMTKNSAPNAASAALVRAVRSTARVRDPVAAQACAGPADLPWLSSSTSGTAAGCARKSPASRSRTKMAVALAIGTTLSRRLRALKAAPPSSASRPSRCTRSLRASSLAGGFSSSSRCFSWICSLWLRASPTSPRPSAARPNLTAPAASKVAGSNAMAQVRTNAPKCLPYNASASDVTRLLRGPQLGLPDERRCAQRAAIERTMPFRHPLHRQRGLDAMAAAQTHFSCLLRRGKERADRFRQRLRVAVRNEKAVFALAHQLGISAHPCRDDRQPGRHRLHQRVREAFRARAEARRLAAREDRGHVQAVTEQEDAFVQAELGDPVRQVLALGSFTRAEKAHAVQLRRKPRHCFHERTVAFDGPEIADHCHGRLTVCHRQRRLQPPRREVVEVLQIDSVPHHDAVLGPDAFLTNADLAHG